MLDWFLCDQIYSFYSIDCKNAAGIDDVENGNLCRGGDFLLMTLWAVNLLIIKCMYLYVMMLLSLNGLPVLE